MTADARTLFELLARLTLWLALAWSLHFALCRRHPRWDVALWRATLVGLIVFPFTALLLPRVDLPLLPDPEPLAPAQFEPRASSHRPLAPPDILLDARPAPVVPAVNPQPPTATPIPGWPSILLALWGAGALLLVAREIHGWRRLKHLLRHSDSVPAAIESQFEALRRQIAPASPVVLRASQSVAAPFLAGWRKPVVMLPAALLRTAERDDLHAVLAHELTHVQRRDLPWMTLARMAQVVFWPHPLAWRLPAAHAASCELLCDAAAARQLGDPAQYAQALARMALAIAPLPAAAIPFARPARIVQRLARLRRPVSTAPHRTGARILTSLTALILLAACSSLRPVAVAADEGGAPDRGIAGGVTATGKDSSTASAPEDARSSIETRYYRLAPTGVGSSNFKLDWDARGREVAENVKTLLHGKGNKVAAAAEKPLVIYNDGDLIIKDTPENLALAESYLITLPEMNQGHHVLRYNVRPVRTHGVTESQEQIFMHRVVEAIEVFLYHPAGKAEAEETGRRLWFDAKTGDLTIVDTLENHATVAEYLDSLSELRDRYQKVLFLTYAEAPTLASQLSEWLRPEELYLSLGQGESGTLRDGETIRILKINENDPADKFGDSVTFSLNLLDGTSINATIKTGESRAFGDLKVKFEPLLEESNRVSMRFWNPLWQMRSTIATMQPGDAWQAEGISIKYLERVASGDFSGDSARLRIATAGQEPAEVTLGQQQRVVQGGYSVRFLQTPGERREIFIVELPEPTAPLQIRPFNEMNALVIHYHDPRDLASVQQLVELYDHPAPQVEVSCQILEMNRAAFNELPGWSRPAGADPFIVTDAQVEQLLAQPGITKQFSPKLRGIHDQPLIAQIERQDSEAPGSTVTLKLMPAVVKNQILLRDLELELASTHERKKLVTDIQAPPQGSWAILHLPQRERHTILAISARLIE